MSEASPTDSISLARGFDLGRRPPELAEALTLWLIDGKRSTTQIAEFAGWDPATTWAAMAAMLDAGHAVPAAAGQTNESVHPLLDPSRDGECLGARPAVRGDLSTAPIRDSGEYFLASRIDGATSVSLLSQMTGVPPGQVREFLVRMTEAGVVAVPGFEGTTTEAGPAGGGQPVEEVTAEVLRPIRDRLTSDPALVGALRATPVQMAPPGLASDMPSPRMLVLFPLLDEGSSFASVASNGPGDASENLCVLLDMVQAGHVRAGLPVNDQVQLPPSAQATADAEDAAMDIDIVWDPTIGADTFVGGPGTARTFTPGSPQGRPVGTAHPLPASPVEWVEERLDLYVTVPDEHRATVQGLRLGERERRYLQAVADSRYLTRETLRMSSLGRTKTSELLAALWARGLIEFVAEIDQEDEALRSLETLTSFMVRLETSDAFEVLGTHPATTGLGLKQAFDEEKARFSARHLSERSDEFLKVIARINYLIDQAYEQLRDAQQRRAYREKHFGRSQLVQYADVQTKKAGVFLFLKADYASARDLYESAWDMVPDDPIHLALYGYTCFRTRHPDGSGDAGAEMVEQATFMDRDGPEVLLVAAMLERDRGGAGRLNHYLEGARRRCGDHDRFVTLLQTYGLQT